MANTQRVSFTLSRDTALSLTAISTRLGVSKSGLVDSLLQGACGDMMKVLDSMPTPRDGYTKAEAVRLRGKSVAVLSSRLNDLQEKVNDL